MTAQNTAPQKVNKMHVATSIMRKLLAEKTSTETDTDINRKFKQAVMNHPQLKMTKSGANTYCSNVRTFLAGGDPYRHNKAANEKRAQLQQAAKEMDIPYIDTSIGRLRVSPTANTENRWWVVNLSLIHI